MKFLPGLFIPVIITIFLASCQKEVSRENVITPAPGSSFIGDSLLTKYVEIDTTAASGADTVSKILFSFDAQKRIASVSDFNYNPSTGVPALGDSYLDNYFYNGTDTLPYKIITNVLDGTSGAGGQYPIIDFLQYSGGRIVYDSAVVNDGSVSVQRFTYSVNRLIDSAKNSGSLGTFYDARVVYFQYTNGDLANQTDTALNSYNSPFANTVITNQQFSYDSKKNPLRRIGYKAPFYEISEAPGYYGNEINNFAEVNETENTGISVNNFHFLFRYEYNAADYPKIARITDVNDPTSFIKAYFYYTYYP